MLKQLLDLKGVEAVAHFREESGEPWQVHGELSDTDARRLTRLAHDFKRMTQGHADQLALFVNQPGWTPANGWIVHGDQRSVCGVASMVAVVNNGEANLTDVMKGLAQEAFFI
jgi:roadblock/LC7 domain-containing protein